MTKCDLSVTNHGSLFLLTPCSLRGGDWINEHIPADASTWGISIVVEHRYIEDIVRGAVADGLEVD